MTDTAVILDGGKSNRYGRPKGFVEIHRRAMVARLADEMRSLGISRIYVSTDVPDPFISLGLQAIHFVAINSIIKSIFYFQAAIVEHSLLMANFPRRGRGSNHCNGFRIQKAG
jgi:choline kinase